MREITYAQGTLEAMQEEMRRDPVVFLMGEDIARQGGIFGQFKNLAQEFGFERIRDTPISEAVLVGAALGAALVGARPVVDIHFSDFTTIAMDELCNQIAKIRYMSGGQVEVPVVLRAPDGAVRSAAAQHSQSLEAWFAHTPGLKVVSASDPADAKGLLKSAIRSPDPVVYLEHKGLYRSKGPVPDGDHVVPLGRAAVKREGSDVTVITYSAMVGRSLEAALALEKDGVRVEVVDLRSLFPVDWPALTASVRKTGRALVVHEAVRFGGFGAEIAASLGAALFGELKAPVLRLGAPRTPIPFSPPLERRVVPQVEDIVREVRRMLD